MADKPDDPTRLTLPVVGDAEMVSDLDIKTKSETIHPVRGGGLEPPPSIRGLAPQASASAYSATRALGRKAES